MRTTMLVDQSMRAAPSPTASSEYSSDSAQHALTTVDSDSDSVPSELLTFEEVKVTRKRRRGMRPLQPNNVLFVETSSGTYAPRLIVPQFVKSDARLSYANMVAAVYNSCDYNLMARFMKTYFRTDFTVVQELTGNFPVGMKGKYEIYGRETNSQYWYERMLDYPDVLFTIKNVEMKIHSDEDGIIVCKFSLSGTVIENALEAEVQTAAIVDADTDSPTYIIGEVDLDNYPLSARTPVEKDVEDFDLVFDSVQEVDFGVAVDVSALQSQQDLLTGDDIDTFLENMSNKIAHVGRENSHDGSNKKPTAAGEIEDVINRHRLAKMNQPSHEQIVAQKYCFDGLLRMHFDTDGRLFLNEFGLHNGEGL